MHAGMINLPLSIPEETRSNWEAWSMAELIIKKAKILTDSRNDVESKEGQHDESVSPAKGVAHVERFKELIASLVLAVAARICCVRVLQVSADVIDKLSSPLLARLARWRREERELVISAAHWESAVRKLASSQIYHKQITYTSSVETIAAIYLVYGRSWYNHARQNGIKVG
jgi:hypothetical protein